MATPSITYNDGKARMVRAISKITSFVAAAGEFKADRSNAGKRAKISKMLSELNDIRKIAEEDIQVMENAVGKNLAPPDVTDNKESLRLCSEFDNLYYELAAFADVFQISLSPGMDTSAAQVTSNQTVFSGNLSNYQLPKRKFPTFSGVLIEWQGFEDLFKSILSHAPDLPDVERFEYLKTSLEGEAFSLISHLPLTSANYNKAWEVLRARYGNKRDLARIHLDALLSSHTVKSNDASSIKTLLTSILEHTAALDNLDFITRQWNPILVHIFENHLDYDLRARWEFTVGDRHQPSTSDFIEFLRSHVRSAEARAGNYTLTSNASTSQNKIHKNSFSSKSRPTYGHKVMTTNTTSPIDSSNQPPAISNCQLCHKPHSIRKCQLFLSKSPNERFQIAKTERLCINCLAAGHASAGCPSKYKCQTCHRSHHTMLHFNPSSQIHGVQSTSSKQSTSLLVKGQPHKTVLLSTVLLDAVAADGRRHTLRALLDSGSQASFIIEKAVHLLMLPRRHSPVHITTFANTTSTLVRGTANITLMPCGTDSPSFCLDTLIVSQITGETPQIHFRFGKWEHIKNLTLADPTYNSPGSIDLLLGADLLPSILLSGQSIGKSGEPLALETVFGWVLMGPTTTSVNQLSITSLNVSVYEKLDLTLKQFWELEDLPVVRRFSPEEVAAEKIYQTTTTRLHTGRFMVTIPFKKPSPLLGDSKHSALQQFKALENRLNQNNELRQQYQEFMKDYLECGHMELIPAVEKDSPLNYYIPHHCVLRPSSSTTKLRVVFNASARSSVGLSLNDSMYTGPKLQPNIQVVLLRARLWKYVFMTDIKQMYRQILVHSSDRNYLRIFWRFSADDPIVEYRLCTVTYGTSAAPFQALRTIQELANTDGDSYPLAAAVLKNDTFVDDILTGANSEEDAVKCQQELIKLCSAAQFELRKWASNSTKILLSVDEGTRAMSPSVLLDNSEDPELKVLGLKWEPSTDTFSFKTLASSKDLTKRTVLSDIAKVFDPLGLLSPVTFWTKQFMQRLWISGISWDDPVPTELAALWTKYQSELQCIESLTIPRRITHDSVTSVQLHAFSDSSEKGFAAAIYLRVEISTTVHCQLITGKSKVAPLKRSTIPRLELCGAVLAAKLLRFVIDTFHERITIDQSYAWTDSTTALIWIRSSPHRWATFIANRTSQIHELTSPSIWRHVPTLQNPVDCASRGLFPAELLNHPLWWTGPPFLKDPPTLWPRLLEFDDSEIDTTPEYEARKSTALLVTSQSSIVDLLNRFSSLEKILRIIAYCLRVTNSHSFVKITTVVSAEEMAHSLSTLIYYTQRITYSDDITRLTQGIRVSKELRKLDVFLDPFGILRVGGRLTNADIPYAHKHPALLPSSHPLTILIIDHHHLRLNHSGSNALQTYLQREFWIQSARQAIRSRLRLCISCFRTRPVAVQPKMAALPKYRVQQVKPFAVIGVDYAGPVYVKAPRGRSSVSTSAYICLFVCMTTKAVHIELSSDLTTETFLLAFTRFSARRGPIQEVHSDNGTNFVGASRLLTPLQQLTHSDSFQD